MRDKPILVADKRGLFSRIRGRLKHSGTQAAMSDEDESTLEEQLVAAEAHLARVKKLPQSNWKPHIANGQFINYSVDAKADAIAYAKADLAELKTRLRLSQRLPRAKATQGGTQERLRGAS